MKIKTKDVRNLVSILDDIVAVYKDEHPKIKRNWRTYEQRVTERLKTAFRELKPLVHEAVSTITFVSGERRGAKATLTVEQRVLALLIKHIIGKSNRNMSSMFVIFSLLSEIDGSGDGTGLSLTIKVNYENYAQKLKDKVKDARTQSKKEYKKKLFAYSFKLMDLKSRMYVGFGTSFKSENEAFLETLKMVQKTKIKLSSIRLDRYYSCQEYVRLIREKFGNVKIFLIPKSNVTLKAKDWEWKRIMYDFTMDPMIYLEDYFQRNQSESGFSEDKKRTGWQLGQKKADRIDTADMLTLLWHNLHWLG